MCESTWRESSVRAGTRREIFVFFVNFAQIIQVRNEKNYSKTSLLKYGPPGTAHPVYIFGYINRPSNGGTRFFFFCSCFFLYYIFPCFLLLCLVTRTLSCVPLFHAASRPVYRTARFRPLCRPAAAGPLVGIASS